jgi:hypothetical protein
MASINQPDTVAARDLLAAKIEHVADTDGRPARETRAECSAVSWTGPVGLRGESDRQWGGLSGDYAVFMVNEN